MIKKNLKPAVTLEDISMEEQRNLLERIAMQIVKRRLTVPAILALEICKPLNFLGSQVLVAFNPFVQSIFNSVDYHNFALILEKDDNIECLIQLIEELDREENKVC